MHLVQDPESLISEKKAAEFLGLSIKTLQKKRGTGDGPQYIRISSRCIRYRRRDLVEWAKRLERTSTSDTGKPPSPFVE